MGFDAILSEKGKIAYTPDLPLDESCYREVATADVFVLIVGGRYGSEASAGKTSQSKTFYGRYNSITRGEYRAAADRDIPMYVLIERSVYAEYETYLRNKGNKGITYAHVDSVNIFELIEEILTQPRNNPLQQFDKYSEIEAWLREQWVGLFRELLQRIRSQAQIASLQSQVSQLAELNTTFKRYLEEIVSKIAPQKSKVLIETETKRLEDAARKRTVLAVLLENPFSRHLQKNLMIPEGRIVEAAESSNSLEAFLSLLVEKTGSEALKSEVPRLTSELREKAVRDFNALRSALGVTPSGAAEPGLRPRATVRRRAVKDPRRRARSQGLDPTVSPSISQPREQIRQKAHRSSGAVQEK